MRCALPNESKAQLEASPAERALEKDQPRSVPDASARGTSLPGHQDAVGLHQGEIPRTDEEPRSSADDVCSRESVPSPTPTAADLSAEATPDGPGAQFGSPDPLGDVDNRSQSGRDL